MKVCQLMTNVGLFIMFTNLIQGLKCLNKQHTQTHTHTNTHTMIQIYTFTVTQGKYTGTTTHLLFWTEG